MTFDSVVQYEESFRARFNEDLRSCTQELREARGLAAATGPPGPTRHLMGQVQGLWERADVRQNQINALTREKAHAREQCDQMATAQTTAQKDIRQLRAHNEQLKQENERLRQEVLAARATPRPTGPPSVSSKTSSHSGMADQERIRQLTADANRIRGEREALRKDNAKLRAANEKWRNDANREKLIKDTTINGLVNQLQAAENSLNSSRDCLPARYSLTRRWEATNSDCLHLKDEPLSLLRQENHEGPSPCHPLLRRLPTWKPPIPLGRLNTCHDDLPV